ncbi:MAG: DCC1-like thiol-disulfide oxidoreductase family protein [bacterium]|nr:DCC1-like thiol-disulfide oxidoreductase family protein [bacterium]
MTAKIEILYDDQCPICRGYCTKVQLQAGAGALVLTDARKDGALMDEVTRQGLDIDEGMVVKIDGNIYYGSEAMRVLVPLTTAGPIERALFRTRRISALVYGFCKGVRNLLLRLLRIKKIENLKNPRYRS